MAGSELACALGIADLLQTLAIPFNDTSRRFWEKALAFWAICLVGVASASTVTWLGWQAIGPILSCGIACGIVTGATVWRASPGGSSRAGGVLMVILRASLIAVVFAALLMGIAHQWMFLPSTARILAVSAVCFFIVYCVASLAGPLCAYSPPKQWPAAVREMLANWHKAAGVSILAFAYLLCAAPAAVVIAVSPVFFEGRLSRLAEKPMWAWLAPMAAVTKMVSAKALEMRLSASGGFGAALLYGIRRTGVFLATVPAMIIASCYAILTATAHILAQLGSIPLEALEKE